MEKYTINRNGTYIVHILGKDTIWKLPSGAKEVPKRPNEWSEWLVDTWVENLDKKFEIFSNNIRAERDQKLTKEVDVIAGNALRWSSLSPEQQKEWSDYREALLNVPQQEGFPYSVVWPNKPQ